MLLNIKPLSVNKCWQGKRFKTKEYDNYRKELVYILPKLNVDFSKKLALNLDVGISCSSDLDNVAKPFIDALQDRYGFNDKNIEQIHLYKNIVRKGHEFINFEITELVE